VDDSRIRKEKVEDSKISGYVSGADPGFLLGGGAPLRNEVTIHDFS